ncbi:hypothetical protein KBD08_03380 [Candidatus Babeliales bacterium]|nr:hypothetical protein [Candidatus Babeliales bacterium]
MRYIKIFLLCLITNLTLTTNNNPYWPDNGSASLFSSIIIWETNSTTTANSTSEKLQKITLPPYNNTSSTDYYRPNITKDAQHTTNLELAQQKEKRNQDHITKYGVSEAILRGDKHHVGVFETRHCDTVCAWIIQRNNMTKEQALNAWNEYCNTQHLSNDKQQNGRARITTEYNKRLKNTQQSTNTSLNITQTNQTSITVPDPTSSKSINRSQLQQENIRQHMHQCGLNHHQDSLPCHDFHQIEQEYKNYQQICNIMITQDTADAVWLHRAQAMQKTIDQNFIQEWHHIQLSPQAQGYLQAYGFSAELYQSCYGTSMQQQLHSEICHLFEESAKNQSCPKSTSSFLNMALNLANISYWANQLEALTQTTTYLDCAKLAHQIGNWVIQNVPLYIEALTKVPIDSAWDFIHMASHPIELITNLGTIICLISDTATLLDEDSFGATLPAAVQARQQRYQDLNDNLKKIHDSISTSSGPERVYYVTKFIADCMLQHTAFKALASAAHVAQIQNRCIKTIRHAANIIDIQPSMSLATEQIGQATHELETVLHKSLQRELSSIEQSIAQETNIITSTISTECRSLQEITQEIEQYGKIPLTNQALCQETQTIAEKIVQDTNVTIDRSMRLKFGPKWHIIDGIKKRVSIDIDHILNYEISFKINKQLGCMEIDLTGGHLAGSTEALAKKGLIKIIDKRKLPSGCWQYEFEDSFSKKNFTKTEFHHSWSKEKIIEETCNLFENINIAEYATKDKKLAKYIKHAEQEMSIVMKKHEKNINITTSVPYKIKEKII